MSVWSDNLKPAAGDWSNHDNQTKGSSQSSSKTICGARRTVYFWKCFVLKPAVKWQLAAGRCSL